jgi:hypothetical protein
MTQNTHHVILIAGNMSDKSHTLVATSRRRIPFNIHSIYSLEYMIETDIPANRLKFAKWVIGECRYCNSQLIEPKKFIVYEGGISDFLIWGTYNGKVNIIYFCSRCQRRGTFSTDPSALMEMAESYERRRKELRDLLREDL